MEENHLTREVILLLDRSFDRAEPFARLKERVVCFVVRLRQGTWIEHGGQVRKREKALLAPGQARVGRASRLRREGRVTLNVVAAWGAEGQVPLPIANR